MKISKFRSTKRKKNDYSNRLYRTSPAPETIRWRKIPRILGITLIILGVLVGLNAVFSSTQTTQVLQLTRNLEAGSVLNEADVKTIEIETTNWITGYPENSETVIGKELNTLVFAGDLLSDNQIGIPSEDKKEITLSLDQRSLPSDIQRGNEFDLWVTPSDLSGNAVGQSYLILAGLVVATAPNIDELMSTEVSVTVWIYSQDVAKVLDAIAVGQVYLVRT